MCPFTHMFKSPRSCTMTVFYDRLFPGKNLYFTLTHRCTDWCLNEKKTTSSASKFTLGRGHIHAGRTMVVRSLNSGNLEEKKCTSPAKFNCPHTKCCFGSTSVVCSVTACLKILYHQNRTTIARSM